MLSQLTFRELLSTEDACLPSWLDLYEASFPPEEKLPADYHVEALAAHAERPWEHLLVCHAAGDPTGLAMARCAFLRELELGYLVYIAVRPGLRGGGIGSALHDFVEQTLRADAERGGAAVRALCAEVESPAHPVTRGGSAEARQRLRFYRRLGYRRLSGVRYLQRVPEQPPVELLLLFKQMAPPFPASEAYGVASAFFGGVTRTEGSRLRWR